MREKPTNTPIIHSGYWLCMVLPTCFGITLPSSGSIPSAFWEMLNWGAVNRILWVGVLCLVTWYVAISDCKKFGISRVGFERPPCHLKYRNRPCANFRKAPCWTKTDDLRQGIKIYKDHLRSAGRWTSTPNRGFHQPSLWRWISGVTPASISSNSMESEVVRKPVSEVWINDS
jgi:hypothetical protein